MTTCINCQYSVETLLDDLRQQVFQRIQPNLYQRKLSFLRLILLCQQRIQSIDSFLKLNSISDGFEGEQVVLTAVALERKYLLGEVVDQSYELLDSIEVYLDYFFPYAQHGALLYSVLQRINLLSPKNYQFSIELISYLLDQLFPLNPQKSTEDKEIWKDIEDKQYPQLPSLIEINDTKKEEFAPPDQKQIDDNLKKMIQSFIKLILPQLLSEHRLEFLVLLQLLLKTAVESGDGKSEILQLELLATGLPRIELESLSFPSTLSKKPSWIESDLVWFDIVSLSNLFNEDDVLHHLSEFILSNDQSWKNWYDNPQLTSFPNPNGQQFSELDKLLVIRLIRPDNLMIALREYVIEQFDLNNVQMNETDFQGVNIITLPSIPVKSILPGEFLINKTDFDHHLENVLKGKGKKIREIDCQFVKTIQDLNDDNDIIFLKNVHEQSFSTVIKQIRHQCRSDIVLTKEASVELVYLGARLHHYDCLIEGKVALANLLYRDSNNYIREIIGQLISNSSSILRQCQTDELTIIYGSILIQSILVYYQQIFEQSSFSLQWTRNLPQLILNIIKNNKDKNLTRDLVEMAYPTNSPLLTKLLNELFQQISSKSSIRLFECQFEIPQNESQFNLQWFLSKHPKITLTFNDFPTKQNSLQHQFYFFTEQLNKLWHEKSENIYEKLHISLIHENIHLLKERLPPVLNLPSFIDFKQDLISIALYQEMIYFNKQLEIILKDINEMEDMLPYGNLLLETNLRFKSIGFDLQRNQIPSTWFSNQSSAPKYISIVQFIHQSRHRFNEYYSWINSLNNVEKIDSHCIHRSKNLIELMCLSEALKLNVTQDKIRCIGQWASSKDKKFSSESRHLILYGLTIINGIVDDNNRIKSISEQTNPCPPIEIFATESKIDSHECPIYATASFRLDPPLFNLIINEQIDQMTYIVFQNDNEDVGRIPFPTMVRQEQEKNLIIKSENNLLREMSPTSQLSQSTDRTNTPSVKDIRRDEPMLGF